MSSIGSRFKLLGLCMLALCGLTALMAAGAQGNWLENGVETTVNKNVLVKAHTTLTFSVPALNIEFRCTTLKQEGLKLVAKSATAEGKVAFSGCTSFSKGVEVPKCAPENQPIVAGGLALVKLLALTQNGVLLNVLLYEQKGIEKFTTIKLSPTCALSETSNITGSVVFECGKLEPVNTFVQVDCGVSSVAHLLQAPAQTIWWESNGAGGHKSVEDKLKFGANAATVGGIASDELESGNSWAGHV
jgi:hypothetical protein